MTYQRLTAEIDRCKATAQAFLNMENNNAPSDYARDFFESLRNRTMEGSNSAINGLMDYDGIFDSMVASDGEMDEAEADMIWSHGSRYFSNAKATLVV